MFIEVPIILEGHPMETDEDVIVSDKFININEIEYISDWSGENDESMGGFLNGSIKLRNGEYMISSLSYCKLKSLIEEKIK